uniref:Uncharacterized protein n=1 Tax=Sphaerodactylus townsendi TaxID=933632 RepID=A0ACB8EL45_9SAUR
MKRFLEPVSRQGSVNSETELSQYFLQDGTSQLTLSETTVTGSSDEEQFCPKSGSSSLDESFPSPGVPTTKELALCDLPSSGNSPGPVNKPREVVWHVSFNDSPKGSRTVFQRQRRIAFYNGDANDEDDFAKQDGVQFQRGPRPKGQKKAQKAEAAQPAPTNVLVIEEETSFTIHKETLHRDDPDYVSGRIEPPSDAKTEEQSTDAFETCCAPDSTVVPVADTDDFLDKCNLLGKKDSKCPLIKTRCIKENTSGLAEDCCANSRSDLIKNDMPERPLNYTTEGPLPIFRSYPGPVQLM